MASTAGRFLFLTQFMSSQRSLALFDISWIFWSKNMCLVLFTIFLNCFQSTKLLDNLYFSRFLLQFISHQLFECLEMLTIFEFFSQALLIAKVNESMVILSDSTSVRLEVSMVIKSLIISLMNAFSSTLPLAIKHFLLWICCSLIGIEMVSGVWSNDNLHSRWIEWLSKFSEPYLRNTRSITELELWLLSEYLVGTGLVEYDRPNKRESVISISKSLWVEWYEYKGS